MAATSEGGAGFSLAEEDPEKHELSASSLGFLPAEPEPGRPEIG